MDDQLAICRFCAVQKPSNELTNLQTEDEESCLKILNKLARLNIEVDLARSVLPKTVCFLCINSLDSAFTFVTVVEQAQVYLNQNLVEQKQELKHENNDCILREVLASGFYNVNDKSNDESEIQQSNKYNEDEIDEDISEEESNSNYKHKNIQRVKRDSNSESESLGSTMTLKVKKQAKSVNTPSISKLNKSWKNYLWQCRFCGAQFPNINDLRNHSMQFHSACNPYQCTDCKEKKNKDNLNIFLAHLRGHRKYLHLCCLYCPATFSSIQKAILHKSTHNIESDYICTGCNLTFSTEDEYNQHVRSYFKDGSANDVPKLIKPKIYPCKICKKPYNSTNGLKHHMFTHIGRNRDHVCKICGKGFFVERDLTSHLTTHSDLRPYQCEVCKSAFKCLHRLRQHAKAHFKQKELLCNECGKCFREKRQLAKHITIHSGVLPHACPHCDKRFRSSTYLKKHLLQHTGATPFTCEICHQQFRDRANRYKHMKRKHGVDQTKRKFTPNGLLPVDPETGKVIYPEEDKVLEWKKEVFKKDVKKKRAPKSNEALGLN